MLNKIKKPFVTTINFLKGVVTELKQVEFLNRRTTLKYSLFIIISLILGIILLFIFDKIFFQIRNSLLQI